MNNRDAAPVRYKVGDLTVNTGTHRVSRGAESIKLTKRSFELFLALIRAAPNLVASERLLEEVWGKRVVGHETVTQRVKLIRDALGDDSHNPKYIEVVWGEGYRLCADVELLPGENKTPKPGANPAALNISAGLATTSVLVVAAMFLLTWFNITRDGTRSPEEPFEPPLASIAVMPFLNINDDPDNEFLALGVPDSVLHKLANLEDILVIARTSSFAFGNGNLAARQIGSELNVRYLLEGSVRRSGREIRIVAQLISTLDASHVWSLERRLVLDDIFKVQDEIVLEIANALQLTLVDSERERLLAHGTTNVPAYLAYLRGEQARHTVAISHLYEAVEHYAEATELDPAFARAWLGIGRSYYRLGQLGAIGRFEANEHIEKNIARALALDGTLGEAYAVKAMAMPINPSMAGKPDLEDERDRLLAQAMEYSPNDPTVLRAYTSTMCSPMQKDYDCHTRKASMLTEIIRQDPEDPGTYIDLAWTFVALDRPDVPGSLFVESIRRNADFIPGYTNLALWHWGSTNVDWKRSVICLCEALERDPQNPHPASMLSRLYVDLGLGNVADDFIDKLGEIPDDGLQDLVAFDRLKLHLYRGEIEEAAAYARAHMPQIGQGSLGILAYGAILESAMTSGEYEPDIELLESSFEIFNIPIEYKDGYIRSRTAALIAAPLAELNLAVGNQARATKLIDGAIAYFEREVANGSVWRASNAWAYAATLNQSGELTRALAELELVPVAYLRNSWYISRAPLFGGLRDHEKFEIIASDIADRIRQQRENVASIPDSLPPCVPQGGSSLPGLLALELSGREPTTELQVTAVMREPDLMR